MSKSKTGWSELFHRSSRSVDDTAARIAEAAPKHEHEPLSPLFARMKRLPSVPASERGKIPWAYDSVRYAERAGRQQRALRLWQCGFFASLFVLGGLNFQQQRALVECARAPRVAGYVVETCKGTSIAVAPLERVREPGTRLVAAAVSNWVLELRTVERDPASQSAHMRNVFAMLPKNSEMQKKIQAWYDDNDPYKRASRPVEVEVFPATPVGSSNRFKVEWVERERDLTTSAVKERHLTAYVSVTIAPPQSEEALRANLNGIYITDLSVASKLR